MKALDILKKYYVNFRGWTTNRKIVVIESDDWGSIRMSSKSSLQKLTKLRVDLVSNLFCKYDTLESKQDLSDLFTVLQKFKDKNDNYPVITANTIVANPNFIKIKKSNFKDYSYEDIRQTYKRKFQYDNVLEYWLEEGVNNKRLLYPQFHGREHFNFQWWLEELRHGDSVELLAFEEEVLLGLKNDRKPKSSNGYMAAFDFCKDEDTTKFKNVITEGVLLFEEIFGFRSKSFVAPCSIRSDNLDNILKGNELLYHQMGQQTTPLAEGYKLINRFWGDKNDCNQIYWRRNSTFEPYKGFANLNYQHQVLTDAKIAFRCGKPLVINTHRINYVGGIEKELPKFSLKLLEKLLRDLLDRYPDIEFMTSDKLGDYMKETLNL